jgi:hypothetical protein
MNDERMNYRAYTVIRREGDEDFWLPIGAAFAHKDGKGYNVTLQALPIDGKVVLRLPKDEDEQPKKDPEERRSGGDRDRRPRR